MRDGFSAMAAEYDAMADTDPVTIWMRRRIRQTVEASLVPGASILEINCGSGLDAAYFAARGYQVHATDIAPGMLEAVARKADSASSGGRLSFQNLSNTDLDSLTGGPYDLIFSNLGGLNCVQDLTQVTRHFSCLLRPGGKVALVVMPPFCPWEVLQAFRGHSRTAFRRFSRNGTEANVGGSTVHTWYHPPGALGKALGPDFQTVAMKSFCLAAPPSYFRGFIRRQPAVTRALTWLDDRFGGRWPLKGLGDFYLLVASDTRESSQSQGSRPAKMIGRTDTRNDCPHPRPQL